MNSTLVVDASAVVEYLFGTPEGRRLSKVFRAAQHPLNAPALCDVEVAAAIRRALLSGRLNAARALDALRDYLELPLVRHGHESLLPRVIALRNNLTAYDATYVALAERLGATLATSDAALRDAVKSLALVPLANPI